MSIKAPTFLISKILKDSSNKEISDLCKELYSIGILTKEYKKDNILLLYTKYNTSISNIQKECKSIIIDSITREIISYSCYTPILNNDCDKYFENIDDCITDEISTSYEGPYVSLFYHNDKWYFSTRRIIKTDDTLCKYYDDFEEIVKKLGFDNTDVFYDTLNKLNSYHFILISYNNKAIIDYTSLFGNNYMLLYLINIKDKNQIELPINEYSSKYLSSKHFIVMKTTNYNEFIYNNNDIYKDINYEGVIVKRFNQENNYYRIFKLQTHSYQFIKYTKSDEITGLIYLYQHNKLYDYLYYNYNHRYILINNAYKNTVFTFDNTFKLLTLEFIYLYNKLWDDTNNHTNTNIYNKLSKEYKKILYNIRGYYMKYGFITFKNVINILKSTNTEYIINILKYRHSNNINKDNAIDNIYYSTYNISCKLLEQYYINLKV